MQSSMLQPGTPTLAVQPVLVPMALLTAKSTGMDGQAHHLLLMTFMHMID